MGFNSAFKGLRVCACLFVPLYGAVNNLIIITLAQNFTRGKIEGHTACVQYGVQGKDKIVILLFNL